MKRHSGQACLVYIIISVNNMLLSHGEQISTAYHLFLSVTQQAQEINSTHLNKAIKRFTEHLLYDHSRVCQLIVLNTRYPGP